MIRVTVSGMAAHSLPQPNAEGAALARMTVALGPLLVTGCTLTRLGTGELRVLFPKFGRERRVVLRGQAERDRLTEAAVHTYRVLTGRDPAETPLAKASPKTDTFHDPA